MKKLRYLVMVCLLTMFVLSGCQEGAEPSTATEAAMENQGEVEQITEPIEAFDFTVEKADGTTFTLSEKKGKVVLLNFWATWCGPCVYEMPVFEQLYEEYSEDEVEILAINCMEDKETVDKFIEESGWTFPFAYDVDGEVGALYYVSGIPFTVVIDKEGIIQGTFSGTKSVEEQYMAYKNAIEYVRNMEEE